MIHILSLYVSCLALAQGGPVRVPENGIYTWREGGAGMHVKRTDGAEIVLGKRIGQGFGQGSLRSDANDNSRLTLHLTNAGPLEPGADSGRLAVIIDGLCLGVWSHSDVRPNGTLELNCSVYGEAAARQVAKALKIEPQLRKDPGHRFQVRWTPEKEAYQVGEPMVLKLEIRNTGKVPFSFIVGGQQRGPRDNQYRFLCYRSYGHGRAVSDTGDPTNFGGLGTYHTLKPGEAFTRTVSLDKWFAFTDPDTYRVTGIYQLQLIEDPPATKFVAADLERLRRGRLPGEDCAQCTMTALRQRLP
jgi:hypothetical protein